jgi:small subunit ribosomal protein S2
MYLTTRWLGGLFTNFETVNKTLAKMTELEATSKDDTYTKREQLMMTRHLDKLERYVGGIRAMQTLPDAIFIVDSRKEDNAVREARKMNVTTIAIVDTNADPTVIDYPIPANDDAIRAISILVKTIADAFLEGKEMHAKQAAKAEKKEEAKSSVKDQVSSDKKEKPEVKVEVEVKAKAKAEKVEKKPVVKKVAKTTNPPSASRRSGKKEA